MIKMNPSTEKDVTQIEEWTRQDPYHFCRSLPTWWLTGNGLLAFRLEDDEGPLTYVRLDEEGEHVRIHIQFAPREAVSRKRLIVGLVEGLRILVGFYKEKYRGFIFNSVNPSLVAFMTGQRFKSVGGDDYRLDFEGQ